MHEIYNAHLYYDFHFENHKTFNLHYFNLDSSLGFLRLYKKIESEIYGKMTDYNYHTLICFRLPSNDEPLPPQSKDENCKYITI